MIEKSREAIAISPDAGRHSGVLQRGLGLHLPRSAADAEQALPQAMARADQPDAVDGCFPHRLSEGRCPRNGAPGRAGQRQAGPRRPAVPPSGADARARGPPRDARESARHAIELASAAGSRERAAAYETAVAVWEAWYGNAAAATRRRCACSMSRQGATSRTPAPWRWRSPATRSRAQTIADDLDRRFPEDTSVRFNYLPTLRALAALQANDPSRAIELLQPAATYEFAQPGISFYGAGGVAFGAMYPTYVRGMAYLALRKPTEAAAEFQKILDHPGVVLEDPMGALARLQIARAWTMAGDDGKAKAAYGGPASAVEGRRSGKPGGAGRSRGAGQIAVIPSIDTS